MYVRNYIVHVHTYSICYVCIYVFCACILGIYVHVLRIVYMLHMRYASISQGPLSESCVVPHHEKKKKRNIVSVADPTDIISNLQLAQIPLEESSELTRGLSPEDVHRLNRKQERMRSPSDRLKLFSFSKRHLRLPFGRGRSKREKQGNAQEKTTSSPKRKSAKQDSSIRNKRLSRAQAGTETIIAFMYMYVCIDACICTLHVRTCILARP